MTSVVIPISTLPLTALLSACLHSHTTHCAACCFMRDPDERSSTADLLQHFFLADPGSEDEDDRYSRDTLARSIDKTLSLTASLLSQSSESDGSGSLSAHSPSASARSPLSQFAELAAKPTARPSAEQGSASFASTSRGSMGSRPDESSNPFGEGGDDDDEHDAVNPFS